MAIALVATAFGAGMIYQVLGMVGGQPRVSFHWYLVSACVVLGAVLGYLLVWAFTARIAIYADRFEQSEPFVNRVLSLDEIAGRSITKGRGAGYPIIVPKHGMRFSIDDLSYGLDARFKQWYTQLKDLG
jgi:hypothetical protein